MSCGCVERGPDEDRRSGVLCSCAQGVGFVVVFSPSRRRDRLAVRRLAVSSAAAPEVPPRDALTIHSRSPFEGAQVMNMSPAVAEELSLDGASQGVVVAAVGDNSTAAASRRAKGRRHRRGQRPEDRDDARSGESLRGTRAVVGSDHPARRADNPHPTRRIERPHSDEGAAQLYAVRD